MSSWGDIKQREPEDSFWKQWGIHILLKQEQDGSIILGDSHEYADGKDKLDFNLRQSVNDYLVCEGQRIFQLPSWNVESAWYGVYSQSKDASGIFNKTVDERIHIVTGIGGKGMTSSLGYAKQHLEEILNV